MNQSDATDSNHSSDDDSVIEIPETSPNVDAQAGSKGKLGSLLASVLGLVVVAIVGFGSTSNWFGWASAESDAADEAEQQNPSQVIDLSQAIGATNDKQTAEPADINDSAAQTVSGGGIRGSKQEPILGAADLPPLDPVLPSKSVLIIEECKRVANHLFGMMPNSLEAREMLARTEFEFGDTAKAQKVWEEILKRNPGFLYALRGLGDIATANGQLQTAVDYYRKATEVDPNSIQRKVTLGVALTQAAQLDDARKVLEEALEKSPEHGGVLAELGQVLALLGEQDQAREKLESALEAKIPPADVAKIHLTLVSANQRLRDREKAKFHQEAYQRLSGESAVDPDRKDYDDLEAIQEDVGRFYVDMARVYLAGGYVEAADQLLLRTSQMDKDNLDCRQALAFRALNENKPYEGIRWLRELAKLQPENFAYPKEISRLYVQSGELPKAERTLTEFLDRSPENAEALQGTTMFFYSVYPGTGQGIPYAERLVTAAPSAATYALLASVCDAAGKNEPAIQAMERAVELDPENLKYADALKVLRGEITPEASTSPPQVESGQP